MLNFLRHLFVLMNGILRIYFYINYLIKQKFTEVLDIELGTGCPILTLEMHRL